MRKVRFTFGYILALTALIALTSCQRLPYLTANIANENYKALYILAAHGQYDSTKKGFLIIAGDNSDLQTSKFLAIIIKGDKAGDYELDLTLDSANIIAQCEAVYYPNGQSDSNNVYIAKKGAVNISSIDMTTTRLSGSFKFEMVNKQGEKINIENGKFGNLIYIEADKLSDIFNFNLKD